MAAAVQSNGNGQFSTQTALSVVLTCRPDAGGSNLFTLVRVFSVGAGPSSVVYAGTGPAFQLIKNVSMGGWNIAFWGAFLPAQSINNVTITFPSSVLSYCDVSNFQNVYQGALPVQVRSNYIALSTSATISFPDTDNLASIEGMVITQSNNGTLTGMGSETSSQGGGYSVWTTGGSPTQPQSLGASNGTGVNIGVAALVIEEFGWIAPNPIPYTVCPYFSGGFARKMVKTLSNFFALNGQAVAIVQDGQVSVDSGQVVNNGAITLTNAGAVIHIGLAYQGKIQLLPLGGDGQTVNQGKERKLFDIVLRVYKSLGGTFGADTSVMYSLPFPVVTQSVNLISDPTYTGDVHGVGFESKWSTYCMPVLILNQPLPFTLLAAIIRSEISEDK